jgi:hypothetical protein
MNTRLRLWLLAALLALSASGSLAQVAPPPTTVYLYDGAGNMTRSTSTAVDPQNCGAVGTTCGFGKTCCSGACVDISSDPTNCKSCGRVCKVPMPYCRAFTCTASPCPPGNYDCNGNCVYRLPCPEIQ